MDIFDLYDVSLPQRLIEYLSYASTIRGRSPGTTKNYKGDLKLFLKFTKKLKTRSNEDISLIDISDIDDEFLRKITLTDMHMFFNYVTTTRKNKIAARARKTASIRAFFDYLERKAKILTYNPARELESPKTEKRNPIYLTLDESKDLLNSVNGVHKERDYCIIVLFLNCGLRISELVSIDITNIKNDLLTVIGKGNKERTVYLNDACIEAIQDYLEVRLEPNNEEDANALFISSNRKRISTDAVRKFLNKYFLESGLTGKRYTPHKLRHTAATLLYKYGHVDIRTLQQILGHENVSTTQIYTHVDEEQLREAVKANPLAEFTKK